MRRSLRPGVLLVAALTLAACDPLPSPNPSPAKGRAPAPPAQTPPTTTTTVAPTTTSTTTSTTSTTTTSTTTSTTTTSTTTSTTTTSTTEPSTTTTTAPSTTTTTEPPGEDPPANPYPDRGSVGVPPEASLTTMTPVGGKLVVTSTNYTLSNVYLKGGIEYKGSGTLTIRNSIIEGGYGWDRHLLSYGGAIDLADTTVRSKAGFTPSGVGAIYSLGPVTARRCDISGGVDGFKVGSNSLIEECWIHDLVPGTDGHKDGVQLYAQSNVTIRNNRFEGNTLEDFDPAMDNAAIWIAPWQNGKSVENVTVTGNFLMGGYYAFKLHSGLASGVSIHDVAVHDNVFGPHPAGGGYTRVEGPASEISEWSDNFVGDAAGNLLDPAVTVPAP